MEHIKIRVGEVKTDLSELRDLDFTPMFLYWQGAMKIVPKVLDLIPHELYNGNKCLSWYDRQVLKHNKVMKEFKEVFTWQKK
tara:strand:- start:2231 stop:2476 length:246 start_codon:yes stop_codon:yes gene_type:complete